CQLQIGEHARRARPRAPRLAGPDTTPRVAHDKARGAQWSGESRALKRRQIDIIVSIVGSETGRVRGAGRAGSPSPVFRGVAGPDPTLGREAGSRRYPLWSGGRWRGRIPTSRSSNGRPSTGHRRTAIARPG